MTPSNNPASSSHTPAIVPETKARDQRVAELLEAALPDSARTYIPRWLSFAGWCGSTGLNPLPAAPDTVVRYLESHGGPGSSFATLRLTASVITKVHELEEYRPPCRDRSVKAALKQVQFQLAKPRAETGALTPNNRRVICLYADTPRKRGRGRETEALADRRGRVDVALVWVLSEAGLSAAEAAELTWGRVRRWDDGSGRITVPGSLTGAWTQEAVVAISKETMQALDAVRPSGAASDVMVFSLSASQIVRRLKAAAEEANIDNWAAFNGSSGRVGLVLRLNEKEAPQRVVERQARKMQPNGIVGRYTSDKCAAEALSYL